MQRLQQFTKHFVSWFYPLNIWMSSHILRFSTMLWVLLTNRYWTFFRLYKHNDLLQNVNVNNKEDIARKVFTHTKKKKYKILTHKIIFNLENAYLFSHNIIRWLATERSWVYAISLMLYYFEHGHKSTGVSHIV